MKRILGKCTVILITLLMLINNSVLLIVSTALDEIENAIDESKINPVYEMNLEKYVNYSIHEETGTLVQFDLKTGIEYDDIEYSPLLSTGILLNLPKIENEYPENVELIGISSKATNGNDTAKDFMVVYDKEIGELKIATTNNEDENGKIYSQNIEDARDEYKIVCYYSSNCYTENQDERNFEITGFVQANVANENETRKRTEIEQNYTVTENISGIVSTNIETNDIYNGYIVSNNQNGTEYVTEYIENLEIDISKKEISDEIIVSTENYFIDSNNNAEITDEIIYKSTKILKNEVLNILGEDGVLQVLDEEGNVLGEVNNDTEVEDNNVYEIRYETELNKLFIKTSKPVKLGTILLQNTKEIKSTVTDVNINNILTKNNITCKQNIEIQEETEESTEENEEVEQDNNKEEIEVAKTIEQKEIYSYSDNYITEIRKAETRIDLSINNTNWTNNIQNEVEFTANLVANNQKYKLFENPVIKIKLPSEVEKVILGEYSFLYSNGLEISNVEVVEDEDIKFIVAKLSGKQQEYYNNSISEGAELIIPATIIVKKDIASSQTALSLLCINENDNEKIERDYDINIESISISVSTPMRSLMRMTASNVFTNNLAVNNSQIDISTEITATLGDKILQNGDIVHSGEYIKYSIKLKNNSDSKIENINVTGSVPEGTTYVEYYYGDAYADDNDLYKSIKDESKNEYVEDISLESEEEKILYYWVKVSPLEDLTNEKNIQANFVVKQDNSIISQETISNTIKKAELLLSLSAWETQREENLWIYKVDVINTTDETINNLNVYMDLPEEMQYKYTEDSSFSISETEKGIIASKEDLTAHGHETLEMFIQIKRIDENKINFDIETVAYAKGDDTDTYYSNVTKQMIYTVGVEVTQTSEKEGEKLEYEEEVEYDFVIKSLSDKKANDMGRSLIVTNYADTNLEPLSVEYNCYVFDGEQYIEENRIRDLTYKLLDDDEEADSAAELRLELALPQQEEIKLKLKFRAREVSEETEVSNCIKVDYEYCGGAHTITSNIIKNIILPRYNLDTQEPEEPEEPEGSEPSITPQSVEIKEGETKIITCTDAVEEWNADDLNIATIMKINEYTARVTAISEGVVKITAITNKGKLASVVVTVVKSHDSEPDNPDDPNNPDNPDNPVVSEDIYSISGFAWEDINKNGSYDSYEDKISGMTVKLFNESTNSIVKDKNGQNLQITTDNNGEYKFSNIAKGKYIVLFEYDSDNYSLTTYKKKSVLESKNSNVVKKEVNIDGNEKVVAVSDTINLENTNIDYINIGIVKNEKFDLSLNKTISKIILNYGGESNEYAYNQTKLAKIEIPKNKISGAIIIVEYQIDITNEGELNGYVQEIIDYLPEGFEFDEELNTGWSATTKGILKNSAYSGTIIKPGETKTIKLYLARILTAESVGILKNTAEISKSVSIDGNDDIDSTVGNRVESEDDYSYAELIISIKTGAVLYTWIIIFILAILIIIKLLIDRKIIQFRKTKILSLFLIALVGVMAFGKLYSYAEDCYYYEVDSGTYDFQGGSGKYYRTYNYETYNSGIQPQDRTDGVLYCTDGGGMAWELLNGMQSNPFPYSYGYSSEVSYSNDMDETTVNPPSISGNQNLARFVLDNENYIVGPFYITFDSDANIISTEVSQIDVSTGNKTKLSNSEYKIVNGSGTNINISSGTAFYLKVDKSVKYVQIKVKVQKKVHVKYTKTVRVKESWTTGTSGAQVLGKNETKTISEDSDKTADSYIILSARLKYGTIRFNKTDSYTKGGVSGAYIALYNEDGSVVEEVKTMESGVYTFKYVPPGKYSIREINAPDGYKLSWQDTNILNNIIVNEDSTTEVTLENTKYTNLKVIKKMNTTKNGNEGLGSGVKFVIGKRNSSGVDLGYIANGSSVSNANEKASLILTKDKSSAKVFTTGSDGSFMLYNLPTGIYYIDEIELPDTYKSYYNMASRQITQIIKGYNETTEVNVLNKLKSGKLIIQKRDFDTGELLNGSIFNITNNLSSDDFRYINKNVTVTNGNIQIDNLPVGKYTVTEIKAPNGYRLELQSTTHNVTVEENTTAQVITLNRQYGNLYLIKRDKDSGNRNLEDITFNNVKFKIYYTTPNDPTKIRYIANYVENENGPSYFDSVSYESQAYEFSTDMTGIFKALNLPSKWTYYVKEVSLNEKMAQYYDINSTVMEVKLDSNANGNNSLRYFDNKQLRVDLEGYVWEDIAINKSTTRDNIYTSADKRVNNLKVILKKAIGNNNFEVIAETRTDSIGSYKFPAKGTYNGKDYQIKISELSSYVVEFEYNGLRYEAIKYDGTEHSNTYLTESNTSKAYEKITDRNILNNNFYSISGENKRNNSVTTGVTGTTNNKIHLTYNSEEDYKSKLVDLTGYTAESLKKDERVYYVSESSNAKMLADTKTAGYEIKWAAGNRSVKNINFGIYERAQPDLAVAADIDKVELSINGYNDTYYYNQRKSSIENNSLPNDNGYDNSSYFSVKFRTNKGYREATYIRDIYDSYIAYSKDNEENGLKVFVTYTITMKNEGTKYERVSLRNYVDDRLTYNSSTLEWKFSGLALDTDINANMYDVDLAEIIAPGESVKISIKYEVNRDTILELLSDDELTSIKHITEIKSYETYNDKDGTVKYGGIDIDSAPNNIKLEDVKTYEDDTDAAPDFKLKKKFTKSVKGIVFEDNPVNLDKNALNTRMERKGDGIYNQDNEAGIANVLVILKDEEGNVAKTYKTQNGTTEIVESEAYTLTKDDGQFSIDGLIPGIYCLEYTYGKFNYNESGEIQSIVKSTGMEVTTQSHKSTIINTNINNLLEKDLNELKNGYDEAKKQNNLWYWYEDSELNKYSIAFDDYAKRVRINKALSIINYNNESAYLEGNCTYEDENGELDLYSMTAKSAYMDLAIEDYRNQETNSDGSQNQGSSSNAYLVHFGIIERPRQSVRIDKEVSAVKVKLANGQVLVEGDPREGNMDYVTYPELGGTLKIEVDNEIIEGATLDLSYVIYIVNNSEIDYDSEEYYKYGTGQSEEDLVKLHIDAIVDYLDEKLSLTDVIENDETKNLIYLEDEEETKDNQWYLFRGLDAQQDGILGYTIDPDVVASIRNRTNIIARTTNVTLGPGEESQKMTMSASKLLANLSNEDQLFDNYVEVLSLSNPVGRFYGEVIKQNNTSIWRVNTPGNFNPLKVVDTTEADNNYYGREGRRAARTVIVPSTGIEKIVIYASIGVICLTILAGGIIIIKKKVLK